VDWYVERSPSITPEREDNYVPRTCGGLNFKFRVQSLKADFDCDNATSESEIDGCIEDFQSRLYLRRNKSGIITCPLKHGCSSKRCAINSLNAGWECKPFLVKTTTRTTQFNCLSFLSSFLLRLNQKLMDV
jgi:hypothetical protein